MKKLPVAVQVYSVRDLAEKDFYSTMKEIKEMGYDGVELAGFYSCAPTFIKETLLDLGLVAVSAHVPYGELTADIDKVIADYKEIGVSFIAVPYLEDDDRPAGKNFEETLKTIAEIGKKLKENGIQLVYHNHDFEFVKMEDGRYGLDTIYETIDSDYLQTEIDTCWVNVSGVNPPDYIMKYKDRAPIVHLKDYIKEGDPSNMYELIGLEEEKKEQTGKFEFRPVGSGIQNFPPILEAAVNAGAKWVVVEQDFHYDGISPMENIRKSREYLKSLGW